MRFSMIFRILFCLFIIGLAAGGSAESKKGINKMTMEQISKLAALKGPDYAAERNAFLSSTPSLPDYPYGLADQDPRFRVQYLILQGWQKNVGLYREMQARIDSADTNFMSRSAAGFFPFFNQTRHLSNMKWRYNGLAFAWEDILKFNGTKPDWQIHNSVEIILGFPHSDSIDPLLIAMHLKPDWSKTEYLNVLIEMPSTGLKERLDIDRKFYTFVRPMIEEALRRQ